MPVVRVAPGVVGRVDREEHAGPGGRAHECPPPVRAPLVHEQVEARDSGEEQAVGPGEGGHREQGGGEQQACAAPEVRHVSARAPEH